MDYLKEDSCHASGDHKTAYQDYGKMRDGLNNSGRAILFSLCGWYCRPPFPLPPLPSSCLLCERLCRCGVRRNEWYAPPDPALGYGGGKTLGNSWRIGPDDTNWRGVLTNIDINAALAPFAGAGGWNDPCLLLAETYKGPTEQRVTPTQSRTQFNMWAVMAAPLLISANVRNMSAMNLETYMNKEVIAVNQDALGLQGIRVAGGSLRSGGGGGGGKGNIPAHTSTCVSGSKTQQWEFGTGKFTRG